MSSELPNPKLHLQARLKVKSMRIGELAKRANVSTSKIRFYESKGLLSGGRRLANGYRDYGDSTLEIIHFIRRAQSLGFTLKDVAAHLSSPRDGRRKARVQEQLEAKLTELEAHMEQLVARRAVLLSLIEEVRPLALHSSR